MLKLSFLTQGGSKEPDRRGLEAKERFWADAPVKKWAPGYENVENIVKENVAVIDEGDEMMLDDIEMTEELTEELTEEMTDEIAEEIAESIEEAVEMTDDWY